MVLSFLFRCIGFIWPLIYERELSQHKNNRFSDRLLNVIQCVSTLFYSTIISILILCWYEIYISNSKEE